MSLHLPLMSFLSPDTGDAERLLERLNRTHFSARLRAGIKAGIPPLSPQRRRKDRMLGEIPASGYLPSQRCVVIHPHVFHRQPPRFVLRYLIHHGLTLARVEQCGTPGCCAHPLCPVLAYGSRVNTWLVREGFPPIAMDAVPVDGGQFAARTDAVMEVRESQDVGMEGVLP